MFLGTFSVAVVHHPARPISSTAYASFAAEYLLNPLLVGDGQTSVPVNRVETPVATIFSDVALITASTMVPISILAAVLVLWGHFSVAGVVVEEERR